MYRQGQIINSPTRALSRMVAWQGVTTTSECGKELHRVASTESDANRCNGAARDDGLAQRCGALQACSTSSGRST